MSNADFEAGVKFVRLEESLKGQLMLELEDLIGSVSALQARAVQEPTFKREYEEYVALARQYGVAPSSEIVSKYTALAN
jgi:hypothetical protein